MVLSLSEMNVGSQSVRVFTTRWQYDWLPAVTTADVVVVEATVAGGIEVGSAVGLMFKTVGVVETCAEG